MRVLLIDGYNFIYRADVGFKSGDYYLVYNFFRNLRSLIEKLEPDKVFFVLEGSAKFRRELYSKYKENRRIVKQGQEEATKIKREFFNNQRDIIIRLLHYIPVVCARAREYECDDVIATLSEDLKDEEVIIVSNDSDFIQLLQKDYSNINIFNPFKDSFADTPGYHYLTWKCLAGDKSDNIPGILSDKKSIEASITPSILQKILADPEVRANFNLNLDLIRLRNVNKEDIELFYPEVDFELLKQEFELMDFKSIIKETYWSRFVSTFKRMV